MLRRLLVRNYVLIDSLDIEFPEGLVIITGQTGAGKSILLGALNLVLGARADASVIGEGGGNCIVEAEFSADLDRAGLRNVLQENDIDCPDGILTVRRVVNPTGRSRSFVNDSPVAVPVLQSLSSHLVDIHSQHQTMMLSDRHFRLSVLDIYAGNGRLLEEYGTAYSAFVRLRTEVADLNAALTKAREQQDYVQSRFLQLDSASLRPGELEELEAEQKQLANAGEIKDNLCQAENLFSGTGDDGLRGIDSMLKEAEKHLSRVSGYIPAVASLEERLASCRVELDDIMSEVSDLNSRTDVSQDRLQQVDDRISLLYGLMQKFGCRDEKSLIEERDRLAGIAGDTSAMEEKLASKSAELESAGRKVHELASALHESRSRAAGALAGAVMESMHFLELPSAVFEVPFLFRRKDSRRCIQMCIRRRDVKNNACPQGNDGKAYGDAGHDIRRDRYRSVRKCSRQDGGNDMRDGEEYAGVCDHSSPAGRGEGVCPLSCIKRNGPGYIQDRIVYPQAF